MMLFWCGTASIAAILVMALAASYLVKTPKQGRSPSRLSNVHSIELPEDHGYHFQRGVEHVAKMIESEETFLPGLSSRHSARTLARELRVRLVTGGSDVLFKRSLQLRCLTPDGDETRRSLRPLRIWIGNHEHHPDLDDPTVFLDAWDRDRKAEVSIPQAVILPEDFILAEQFIEKVNWYESITGGRA